MAVVAGVGRLAFTGSTFTSTERLGATCDNDRRRRDNQRGDPKTVDTGEEILVGAPHSPPNTGCANEGRVRNLNERRADGDLHGATTEVQSLRPLLV